MDSTKDSNPTTVAAVEMILKGIEVTFDEFYSEIIKDSHEAEVVEIKYAKHVYLIAGVVVFSEMTIRDEKYCKIFSNFIKLLIKQGELKNPNFKNNILECMNFMEPVRRDNKDSGKCWMDNYRIILGNWIFKKYFSIDPVSQKEKELSLLLGEKTIGQVFTFFFIQKNKILPVFVKQFEDDFRSDLFKQLKIK
ncbi:MAG: hypothetical protein MUO31_09145 [Thermodesulfovibrionales bacterium]|nr:hypothetical protein [Thermodesulfovibrionales bacterium]